MNAPPPDKRRANVRRRALWTALLAAIIGTSVLIWWYPPTRRAIPLEPGWEAAVTVLAGDGVPTWRDGDAAHGRFSEPFGVAAGSNGLVYVADAGDAHRIRAISASGFVVTVAGDKRGFVDGRGAAARFDTPSGLARDGSGNLYVADTGNNAIRQITPDGLVWTFAGGGTAGYRDGPARQARFNGPVGIAVDTSGRVIVADTYNDRIRAIAPDGTVSTLAGLGEPGAIDGQAADATFDTPSGVAVDSDGNIFVADTGNGAVRVIDRTGRVSTMDVAVPNGPVRPIAIAIAASGELYVSDETGRILEISTRGTPRVLAGSLPGFRNGTGQDARFRRPAGIAVLAQHRLLIGDAGNALVRLLTPRRRMDLRIPASPLISPEFDAQSFARVPLLWPVSPMEGPHEIAGTIGEARGGQGFERFHAGIDVRTDEGTPVFAIRDGASVSPVSAHDFGTLNESLRIGALAYVHIRAGRVRDAQILDTARFVPTYDELGTLVRVRVKRGARFIAGEPIGSANAFNHVHLNVGWPGEEHNPLRFGLAQFDDHVPPTIARHGIRLYDLHGTPLTRRARGRLLISERVQIVVDAWDQADGNRRSRRLGLYQLGYQVLNVDGSPAPGFERPRDTIRFDRLWWDPHAARVVYASGSGIPFYGRRTTRFLYIVTNTFRDGVAAQGFWDTTSLPPGNYTLRIHASDVLGNVAIGNRDLPVTIIAQDRSSSSSDTPE